MSAFSAEWLALREPADHAARSAAITQQAFDALPRDTPIRILDLAAGTGSNFRYLTGAGGPTRRSAPTFAGADPSPMNVAADLRVPPSQGFGEARQSAKRDGGRPTWLLVDHDPVLLACIAAEPGVETRCVDLSTLDDPGLFAGRSLVTASALLDLVSEPWLQSLAARCAEAGSVVLFALSYDGRIVCSPEDPDDASIVARVNEHQLSDKGFGPAAGPDATNAAARCFEAVNYRVQRASSDWVLQPDSGELQRRLIDGWAQAAAGIAPERVRAIDAWRDRRLAHVAAGWSTITVGHEDFVGVRSRA
jgi:hypothetical protein